MVEFGIGGMPGGQWDDYRRFGESYCCGTGPGTGTIHFVPAIFPGRLSYYAVDDAVIYALCLLALFGVDRGTS